MMVARIDDECREAANKNNIPALLIRIRNLKALKRVDLDEVCQISEAIHGEWKKMKSRFRKKLIRNNLFISKLYSAQEADEEIIFGLMHFLNEKITKSLKLF